jgi:hypothetical protein
MPRSFPFRSSQLRSGTIAALVMVFVALLSAGELYAIQAAQGQRPPLQMTLVDPGPIGAETTTNIYFPQVSVGGGYTTVFTLINTGATTTNGTLFLTDQSGAPFSVNLTAASVAPAADSIDRLEATGSSFSIGPIAPGGTKFFTAAALGSSDPTKSGWARVENTGGSLGGVGTFQLTEGGILKTIAGVLASQTVAVATIPVDDDRRTGQDRFTGYAVANVGSSSITIKAVVVRDTGATDTTFTIQLAGSNQTARFLFQDVTSLPTQFKGSLVLIGQSGAQFSVVALVLNQGLFTAIPVIPEKSSTIN